MRPSAHVALGGPALLSAGSRAIHIYSRMVASLRNSAVPRDRLLCPDLGMEAILERRAHLDESHIWPLTTWLHSVRNRLDPCHAATVAEFDPYGGGVSARILYLAQDPSSTASRTGFISPDNNDATARATTEACAEAGLAAGERIHWNVYPWWLNAACPLAVRDVRALSSDFLTEFLAIASRVKSVVLVGDKAVSAWASVGGTLLRRPALRSWPIPHPSFGHWAKPYKPAIDGRLGRVVAVEALRQAREHAYGAASQDDPTAD